MQRRRTFRALVVSALVCAPATLPAAVGASAPPPLADLQMQLSALSAHAPGHVGIAVEDLATGLMSGVNARASLPAASTIKIPVMVEVFRQLESGTLMLDTVLHLEDRDRDWGWGDMADAPSGTPKTVAELLWLMITQSDNTATNILIRRVGRAHINATMKRLGLRSTHLGDDIRSQSDAIRYALRSSPRDMVTLLDRIARDTCIDPWASREMLAILTGQTHNGLLPVPLPKGVKIAHKTGSLHDTLDDVGIVYRDREPYVIAVMTTRLPDLDVGRAFIHRVSRVAYEGLSRFASWRADAGIAAFSVGEAPITPVSVAPLPPDVQMWEPPQTAGAAPSAIDPSSP